jgi:WD40 repeat protein
LRCPHDVAEALAFSPDGRWLAAGGLSPVVVWDLADGEVRTVLRWQHQAITHLAFSPDGRNLAAATVEGTVSLWDATVRQAPVSVAGLPRVDRPLAVTADGRRVALAHPDGTLSVVEVCSGQRVASLAGGGQPLRVLSFSPDGGRLAAGSVEGMVAVWDARTGERLANLPDHPPGVDHVAYAPDGKLLVTAAGETVRLWDGQTFGLRDSLQGHRHPRFGPNSTALFTCDAENKLRHWLLVDGKLPALPPSWGDFTSAVTALAVAPDGRRLATAEADGTVKLWDVGRGTAQALPVHERFIQARRQLAFSADGKALLGTGDDGVVCVWDVNARELSRWFRSDFGRVLWWFDAAWLPDSRTIAATRVDGTFRLWDTAAGRLETPPGQTSRWIQSLAITPDGQTLITGSREPAFEVRTYLLGYETDWSLQLNTADRVRLWDIRTGVELPPLAGEATTVGFPIVALAPDGRLLAAGGLDGSVRLWDLPTRTARGRHFLTRQSRDDSMIASLGSFVPSKPVFAEVVRAVAFSPDGALLAAVGSQGYVTLWEAATGAERLTLPGTRSEPAFLAFSNDSATLAINHRGQVQLWDVRTGVQQATLGAADGASLLSGAFSRDGTLLATGARDHNVRLWDWRAGKLRAELPGHHDQVLAVAFAPDGKTLATGGSERTLKLWNLPAMQEVASFEMPHGGVHALTFTPDGQTLASGGGNKHIGELYLWHAPRSTAVRGAASAASARQ